jgi:hypothetical protein
MVCNYCNGMWIGCAYGGDVNCKSIIGCVQYDGASPNCFCLFRNFIPVPAGLFSTDGSLVIHSNDSDTTQATNWSGSQNTSMQAAMGALSKAPRRAAWLSNCWGYGGPCGCYEFQGCIPFLPIGVGAPPGQPCGDVRDVGTRGGMGGVRIKFY